MSASPTQTTNPAKRPLEDASSPSRASDQPDAKRPALDKVIKNGHDEDEDTIPLTESNGIPPPAEANGADEAKPETANGEEKVESKDEQGDTIVPDINETKPDSQPTAAGTASVPTATSSNTHDETAWIHIRAVISSPEAATVIGKGGENVSNIRKQSGAKCTVSDYQKGAIERILTVSGVVDASAKAFGLIIRTLNNEPLNEPSSAQSKTYPLRLLIPHVLIGSIIGKGGSRIREIQDASGARLNASDSCLPLSTERSLVVMGVADAVHIATYYVGSTLLEQLNERFGGPAASAPLLGTSATVKTTAAGRIPVLTTCRLTPMPSTILPHHGGPVPQPAANAPMHYAPQPAAAYGAGPHMPPHQAGGHPVPQPHGGPQAQPMSGAMAGAPLTQQIYIPNDMVGAIIGKGGQKINEIRQISGSVIKINEPQDNSNERLVTITGTEECNRMALYMLYSRLGEIKHQFAAEKK
ncbi:hypothetical protein PG991_002682 [Apiospora marii]|uniref:K Homology domain-containing protein n=1 Tax=Apiospora marii TaxID=335849 RepID=A0ABR1SG32_9PEZI